MDLLYSALFGFSTKLYDEIIDLKLSTNDLLVECLKSFNIMLFTLLTYNDMNFALYILSTALFTHGADENHWKTFTPISLFMILYAAKKPDSIPFLFLVFLFFIFIMNAEHKAIPEEASNKKLYSRILFLFVFSFAYFGPLLPFLESYFGNIDFLKKIFGLFIGTLILSIGVQAYLLYFSKTPISSREQHGGQRGESFDERQSLQLRQEQKS
jgi:hypothetical protein